jgi:hypothetical protein
MLHHVDMFFQVLTLMAGIAILPAHSDIRSALLLFTQGLLSTALVAASAVSIGCILGSHVRWSSRQFLITRVTKFACIKFYLNVCHQMQLPIYCRLRLTMHFAGIFLALGLVTFSTLCRSSPTVQLDNATFIGLSSGRVSSFLGIPFAQPPCVLCCLDNFQPTKINITFAGRLISGSACRCPSGHIAQVMEKLQHHMGLLAPSSRSNLAPN